MAHSISLHPVAQLTSPLAMAILAVIVFAPGASNAGSQECQLVGHEGHQICVRNDPQQGHRVFPGSELVIGDERRVVKGGSKPEAYQRVIKQDQMLVPAGINVDSQAFSGGPQKTPPTPPPSSSPAKDLSERLSAGRRCLPGQCANNYQGTYGGRQVYGTNSYAWISGYRTMGGYRTMSGYGSMGGYSGVVRRW
jgi:hypothetical protein